MIEVWKDIKGFEGIYQVSNLGRVRSLDRVSYQGHKLKGKILKQNKYKANLNYLAVKLYSKGHRKTYRVHQLVAQTFLPNPNNYKEINHKDEEPSNNRVDNLEWCSRTYNNNYGNRLKKLSNPVGLINTDTNDTMEFDSLRAGRLWLTQGKRKDLVYQMIRDNTRYHEYEVYFYIQRVKSKV